MKDGYDHLIIVKCVNVNGVLLTVNVPEFFFFFWRKYGLALVLDKGFQKAIFLISIYSKTGLKWPLKKKTKNCFFKTDYCLMQVKSIAECSKRAFCNTFDLH